MTASGMAKPLFDESPRLSACVPEKANPGNARSFW
jgi:hypothetical protein